MASSPPASSTCASRRARRSSSACARRSSSMRSADVLAGLRLGGLDALETAAEQVELLGALARRGAQGLELGHGSRVGGIRRRRMPSAPVPARSPPKASSSSRCSSGRRSRHWSACPWTATRCSPSSPSTPTGALRPPTCARERPSPLTVRTRTRAVVDVSPGLGGAQPSPGGRRARRRRPRRRPGRRPRARGRSPTSRRAAGRGS